MSEGRIPLIVGVGVGVGALPSPRDRDRRRQMPRPKTTHRETLRDWRSGE